MAAANIIGAGNGLEVGRKLELLTIRGAEAEAEQALRLSNAAAGHSGMITPGPTAMQVTTLSCILLCLLSAIDNTLYFGGLDKQNAMYQTATQKGLSDQQ